MAAPKKPKPKRDRKKTERKEPRNEVPDSVTHAGARNLIAHKLPNWKKGQSGNPNGRPEGPTRKTILKQILAVGVNKELAEAFKKSLGIDAKGCDLEDAVDLTLVHKAIVEKDLKAIQEIKDTLHGKMAEVRKLGGDDEGVPIRVRRIIDDVPLDE